MGLTPRQALIVFQPQFTETYELSLYWVRPFASVTSSLDGRLCVWGRGVFLAFLPGSSWFQSLSWAFLSHMPVVCVWGVFSPRERIWTFSLIGIACNSAVLVEHLPLHSTGCLSWAPSRGVCKMKLRGNGREFLLLERNPCLSWGIIALNYLNKPQVSYFIQKAFVSAHIGTFHVAKSLALPWSFI